MHLGRGGWCLLCSGSTKLRRKSFTNNWGVVCFLWLLVLCNLRVTPIIDHHNCRFLPGVCKCPLIPRALPMETGFLLLLLLDGGGGGDAPQGKGRNAKHTRPSSDADDTESVASAAPPEL